MPIGSETPAAEFRRVAARFSAVVEGVPGGSAWERPSPVAGWVARDVVGHLVDWLPAFLAGSAGIVLPPGPAVDDDPVGAWRVLRDGVQAVLDDPASADRMLSNPHVGDVPVPEAISRFFTDDVFMHTWDLARATGQDETLDPERCAELLEAMQPIDELLRAGGQYGPLVEVDDDADVQTRLLAFIGRDPRR